VVQALLRENECQLSNFSNYQTGRQNQYPTKLNLELREVGLAFCVWARAALGRKWSGTVTPKERHELIERSAAEQLAIFPNGPERNLRLAQFLDRQRMHTLRRRMLPHACQMFFQERADFGTAQIVNLDMHEKFYRCEVRF
jgi:hypothetical protein